MAPKYILEQFLEAELIVNITEHSVSISDNSLRFLQNRFVYYQYNNITTSMYVSAWILYSCMSKIITHSFVCYVSVSCCFADWPNELNIYKLRPIALHTLRSIYGNNSRLFSKVGVVLSYFKSIQFLMLLIFTPRKYL